jgi:xanthine/CO dehydrogenase XdhC/CoxF family maturation factor
MAGPGSCHEVSDGEGKKKESIYHQVKEFLDKGETVAVATIVSTKGSTPREVGAKMVVTAWGEILGTIGGGCGEADVKREAIEVIRTRKPRIVRVDLLDDIASDSPAVCGGIMNIFIDPWWKGSNKEAANNP